MVTSVPLNLYVMLLSLLATSVVRTANGSRSGAGRQVSVGGGRGASFVSAAVASGRGTVHPPSREVLQIHHRWTSTTRLFSGRGRPPKPQQQPQEVQPRRDPKVTGRGRYGKLGKKSPSPQESQQQQQQQQQETITMALPPLTVINGPRPTYFTCRHGYETTLMDELSGLLTGRVRPTSTEPTRTDDTSGPPHGLSTPTLGLVRLEETRHTMTMEPKRIMMTDEAFLRDTMQESPSNLQLTNDLLADPVYALQTLPNCVVVSAASIKGLAQSIHDTLLLDADVRTSLLREALRTAPRSSLAIHGLVPGMFKGQKKPMLERRVQTIVQELTTLLKKGYPAARATSSTLSHKDSRSVGESLALSSSSSSSDRWLLQVLLLTADVAVASLVKCAAVVPTNVKTTNTGRGTLMDGSVTGEDMMLPGLQPLYYWPNWHHPAGLAKVDITNEEMPSSAYRKLMEALECMRIRPALKNCKVYDLGACPGGWTWVLRHLLNCSVTAIDKSPLDPRLMSDPRIEFVKGDAFAFQPADRQGGNGEVWMVSDVIAYPDRILDLLSKWCSRKWADYMVITMKFHGNQPDFAAIQESIELAGSHGYHCRAKHFFNNKNEVTLMVRRVEVPSPPHRLEDGVLGTAMYPSSVTPTTER